MKKDFKKLLQHSLKENMNQYKDDESMKIPVMPDNSFNRIMEQLHSNKFRYARLRQRFVPVLIGILIATMVVGSLAAVTLVVRSDIKFNTKGIHINIGTGQSEQIEVTETQAYQRISDNFGVNILKPKTNQIDLKTANVSPRETILHYENSNGEFLDYQISTIEQNALFFDTQEGKVVDEQVHNKKIKNIKLYEITRDNTDEVWYTACWTTDLLTYTIDTNLAKSDLLNFVEGLN